MSKHTLHWLHKLGWKHEHGHMDARSVFEDILPRYLLNGGQLISNNQNTQLSKAELAVLPVRP